MTFYRKPPELGPQRDSDPCLDVWLKAVKDCVAGMEYLGLKVGDLTRPQVDSMWTYADRVWCEACQEAS